MASRTGIAGEDKSFAVLFLAVYGMIVIEQFKEAFEKKYWEDLFYKKENGKYQLNLWKANELIFLESGILPEHMAITNVCTHCNSKILYSHRTMGNNRGNLCAFLALK